MPFAALGYAVAAICSGTAQATSAVAAASAAALGAAVCRCGGGSASSEAVAAKEFASEARAPKANVAKAEVLKSATPRSAVALDYSAFAKAEEEAAAAAREAVAVAAVLLKPPELTREKVQVAIGAKGSLRSRWVVLNGDLLWLLGSSVSDKLGRDVSAADLPKLADQVVSVTGAKINVEPSKKGGQLTIFGLQSCGIQCARLVVDSQAALAEWDQALRRASGRSELPFALERAISRASSASRGATPPPSYAVPRLVAERAPSIPSVVVPPLLNLPGAGLCKALGA
mmetsp:Transcript_21627/g.74276  ORF Transcript_21627/g.74276 Transcript_21627/m.74276 type:complete len:286 (+) Transcript_21627:40-897(+)